MHKHMAIHFNQSWFICNTCNFKVGTAQTINELQTNLIMKQIIWSFRRSLTQKHIE